jgi:hypothetical protein
MGTTWSQGHFPFYDPTIGRARTKKRKRRIYPVRFKLRTLLGEKYLLIVYMGVLKFTAYFHLANKKMCKQCGKCRYFIPRAEALKVWKKVRSDKLLGTRIRSSIEGICVWGILPLSLYRDDFTLDLCSMINRPPGNPRLR